MKNNVLRLLLLCVFGLAFICLVLGEEKAKGVSTTDRISKTKVALQTGEADLKGIRDDWNKWSRTARDIEDLKQNFLYKESNVLTHARLDLEKMFRGTGIHVPSMEYGYEDFDKEKVHLVRIVFMISENYSKWIL
jgi:hypothetical protein